MNLVNAFVAKELNSWICEGRIYIKTVTK